MKPTQILPLLFTLLITAALHAEPKGYKITVRLHNSSDTALLMAHYFGDKQYLDDTAFLSKQGAFVFTGSEPLTEGMYIVAGQNKSRYFDFFVSGSQQFEMECDPNDVTGTMKVKGSEENKVFNDYIMYLAYKQKEIEPLNKRFRELKPESDSAKLLSDRIDAIDKEVKSYMSGMFTKYPNLLSIKFVKANNEPDITPYLAKPYGTVDSTKLFTVYKQHFFDNFDFSDPRLIYTPVFTSRIDRYLKNLVIPTADSLEKAIDLLFTIASSNKEVQRYLAWYLSLKYETSEIMGHDAMFVYIVKNYLEPGKIDWYYPDVKDRVLLRANTLEPLLLGKQAPDLIMLDTLNIPHSLNNVQAKYTLLFFWESTCGHCKQEMPNVLKFYDEFHKKYDVEIYGVSGDTSMVKWKEYIRKNNMPWINVNGYLSLKGNYHDIYDIHSTPIMYLLDENKKILAKFLLSEQMGELIIKREETMKQE
jgi:thiol-disulfide isomerase/thioredoxin